MHTTMLPRSYFILCIITTLLGLPASIVLATVSYSQPVLAPSRSSERVEALLAQMTLEEKVGQLYISGIYQHGVPSLRGESLREELELTRLLREGQISHFYGGPVGPGARLGRAIQRVAVEESRLGIPILFGSDVIHGFRTVFPVPLGETASFEPELARRTARASAKEANAFGVQWNYGPVVDLSRDQRWGRVVEGAGEDPVLGSSFAAARVRGHQGDDPRSPDSLIATVKHFAAYGGSAGGRDYAQVDISLSTLRDVFLPPYKAAVDAGALAVMTSFNDINGVPSTANYWLLTELLRGEWGFQGVIIGDATSDEELIEHGYARDGPDAALKSIMAGLDMPLSSGFYTRYLPDLVRSGKVSEERVNEAARRVLMLKEKVGLFDDPYRSLDFSREADTSYIPEHDALSREAGRRSIVLLKNEGSILPLRKYGQRIALIGPFAQDLDNIAGPWATGDRSRFITLEAGIRAAMANDSLLEVVSGSEIEAALDGGIEAAVAAARRADIVLLAIGEPTGYSGEAHSRVELTVPKAQQALAEAVGGVGKPIVVLLRNGRALALEGAVRDAQAIIVTWFLGTQNGHAIADVLFGDYNPSAKLPVSFPQHSGQQPYFYNHPRTGRPAPPHEPSNYRSRWIEVSNAPLYAFGHGLSYTTFSYSTPQLSTHELGWNEEVQVTTTVTNTGKVFGEAVPQLYIHDRVASRVRPVRELKKFTKIGLHPGESQQVSFSLSRHDLAFTGIDGRFTAEPGLFDLWVSSASDTGVPVHFELLAPAKYSTKRE